MTEADWLVIRKALGMNWKVIAYELGISTRQLKRYREEEWPVPRKVENALQGLVCRVLHGDRPTPEATSEVAADAVIRRFKR